MPFTESAAATTETTEPEAQEEETKGKKGTKKKTTKKAASADGPSISVDEVCDTFINQAKFFENAIVREQVF